MKERAGSPWLKRVHVLDKRETCSLVHSIHRPLEGSLSRKVEILLKSRSHPREMSVMGTDADITIRGCWRYLSLGWDGEIILHG